MTRKRTSYRVLIEGDNGALQSPVSGQAPRFVLDLLRAFGVSGVDPVSPRPWPQRFQQIGCWVGNPAIVSLDQQ